MKTNKKIPWPTKRVMEQIYEKSFWGGETFDYYSGEGSHKTEFVTPYLDAVIPFLSSFKTPISVCDLGCGDFNIGKELVKYTSHYHAIDIVEALIQRNKAIFKNENLSFECLNIAEDHLPETDCAILRQVLQHLSNKEVQQILDKLSIYKYIILTEHIPSVDFVPNANIISSRSNRLKKKSGLNIFADPFNFKAKKKELLCSVNVRGNKEIINTYLITL